MSIDVEGGEFDVLQSFDFTSHDIALISVEHNFSEQPREDLRSADRSGLSPRDSGNSPCSTIGTCAPISSPRNPDGVASCPAVTAIEILDSMFDLFKQMGSGIALDLQWLEISRRLQLVRAEAVWSADLAFVATKLKAHAAYYAITYRPPLGSERSGKRTPRSSTRSSSTIRSFARISNSN